MSERSEDEELTSLASALRELRPQTKVLNRDVLLYRAGRASTRGWAWPVVTIASTTLAALFAVLWLTRPAAPVVERIVYVPLPATEPQPESPPVVPEPFATEPSNENPPGRYYEMEESILRWGLKGIPPPPPAPPLPAVPTVEQLLQSM